MTINSATDFLKSLENRLSLRRTVAFDRLLARLLREGKTSFVLIGGYAMELRFSNA